MDRAIEIACDTCQITPVGGRMMMHIAKDVTESGHTTWCGDGRIELLDWAYMSIDNALRAVREKVGQYPCHDCLRAISEAVNEALPPKETP